MLVTCKISEVYANPYRNRFGVYPIDQERVAALVSSFKRNGDFGTLPARQVDDTHFELAAGHHRLEALKELGVEDIMLKVEDYDDDQMLSIMADENSKQGGANSAAAMDVVCGALSRLIYLALAEPKNAAVAIKSNTNSKTNKFISELEGGKLVGSKIIHDYLDKKLPASMIAKALSDIKASGIHMAILAQVRKLVTENIKEAKLTARKAKKEADEAAEREAEAKAQAREAGTQREKKAAKRDAAEAKEDKEEAERRRALAEREAQKAEKVKERVVKTARKTKEKAIYDMSCIHLFKDSLTALAFRDAVIDMKAVIPINVQFRFGKACKEALSPDSLTVDNVSRWVRFNAQLFMDGKPTVDDPAVLEAAMDESKAEGSTPELRFQALLARFDGTELVGLLGKIELMLVKHPELEARKHIGDSFAKALNGLVEQASIVNMRVIKARQRKK